MLIYIILDHQPTICPRIYIYCLSKKSCPFIYTVSPRSLTHFYILSFQEVLPIYIYCMSVKSCPFIYLLRSSTYYMPKKSCPFIYTVLPIYVYTVLYMSEILRSSSSLYIPSVQEY